MKRKQANIFTPSDHESAKLNLALLKENFEYCEFFDNLKADTYSVCPELRRPNESLVDLHNRTRSWDKKSIRFFGNCGESFRFLGLNELFMLETQKLRIPLPEVLTLLDPKKDLSEVSSQKLIGMLPRLFLSKGLISLIDKAEKMVSWDSYSYDRDNLKDWHCLQPYERLIKVDLRARKSALIKEFERFIDSELKFHEPTRRTKPCCPGNYGLWIPDKKRNRKEAWGQLEVWRLRKQCQGFPDIARQLNITEDLAKKSFYRAYELIQGEPYNREYFKEQRETQLPDSYCGNCLHRDTCTELCPSMMAHLKSIERSGKEITLSDYESKTRIDPLSKKPLQ